MLREQLRHLVEAEMEQTCQLACMLAAGHSAVSAKRVLGMSVAEFAIARERIARVTDKWIDQDLSK